MSRPRNAFPKFCVDRTGRAFTKIDGKFVTLGRGDNPDSRQRYAALLQNLATRLPVDEPSQRGGQYRATINEVCLRFLTDHCPRYRTSSGDESAEVRCFKGVMRLLRELFGDTRADDFGPLKLRTVRKAMVDAGWSRKFVNKQIGRLRLIFRLAVSWKMVRPDVVTALASVPALMPGESSAPERTPRRAVPDADLVLVRGRLRQRNRDIFDLLLLTGPRPGELLSLTPSMIDRTGEVWRADLEKHKNAHRGQSRVLHFNTSAQLILRAYLTADPDARLFPVCRDTFSEAIKSACPRAGVPVFVPHALRHTTATRLADQVGLESAQRLLGHATTAMTLLYSRSAEKQAVEAVKRLS